MKVLNEHRIFGGVQRFYEHDSSVIGLPMRFSVYLPPQAEAGLVPAVMCLAGLTCNEETFMTKAGAQRAAARLGLALIAPDTSPRGASVPGESESWDFGVGAGFYLDATQKPWAHYWRMESYLIESLLPTLAACMPIDPLRLGILGHSMGGHGALMLALRHPSLFVSVSALAPICAPMQCPWGQKAFTNYLGEDRAQWVDHDATELMRKQSSVPYPQGILIDQGLADKFLAEQLHPHLFDEACQAVGQPLTLRMHEGYDHGYYFISTFIEEHMGHHARGLSSG
ncbi:MAG TPA: S-formylglutathione hydrolase [Burkholderiaceae bacterium]|jgi:S-formylglutathione hydrolase